MKPEELEDIIALIGKDVYKIDNSYENRPFVKAVRITSVEIYNEHNVQLKTANDGCFMYRWGTYYLTYEEAEKALDERYGDKLKFEQLKRCPICKAPANIIQYGNKYAIQCGECGLATNPTWKLKDALGLWNNRTE